MNKKNILLQILKPLILQRENKELLAKYVAESDESEIIGKLDDLHTEDKSSIVNAVNELADNAGGSTLVSITYDELKTLRNNSQLVPGTQYRITDYHCTTTQENTTSADHQFDIIVTADSESVLNENARAIKHDGDTYFKDVNFAAWELKYSLDNLDWSSNKGITMQESWGESRIFPRKPSNDIIVQETQYYCWGDGLSDYYTTSDSVQSGDDIYRYYSESMHFHKTVLTAYQDGKGTVTYMKDEYNNICYYDFKNIQFKRKLDSDHKVSEDGVDTWLYTFHVYNNMVMWEYGGDGDGSIVNGAYVTNNIIQQSGILPNIVSIAKDNSAGTDHFKANKFGVECFNITLYKAELCNFGNYCRNINVNNDIRGVCFGNRVENVSFKFNNSISVSDDIHNIEIISGVTGTIEVTPSSEYKTIIANNSSGTLKIYCEADLVQTTE